MDIGPRTTTSCRTSGLCRAGDPSCTVQVVSAPVLVTGATGTVGRPLVRNLLETGVPVRAGSRGATEVAGAQAVRFDVTDPATWSDAFDGVSTMFLLRPPQVTDIRRGMVPAMAAARVAGVRHVVFLSVQGADRIPVVPHARVERWLRGSGQQWTFLRPSYFFQYLPLVHGRRIRARGEIAVPAGNGRTSFVDVRDVAAVAATVLVAPARHAGRAWSPTGPLALTYREVAQTVTRLTGRVVTYTDPGVARYLLDSRSDPTIGTGLAAVTSVLYTTAKLGFAGSVTDDVARVLGRPARTVADIVRRDPQVWLSTPDGEPRAERRCRRG